MLLAFLVGRFVPAAWVRWMIGIAVSIIATLLLSWKFLRGHDDVQCRRYGLEAHFEYNGCTIRPW